MENVAENFEQLPIAKAPITFSHESQYRIYTDHKNFKLVQAISAVSALEASGIAQAFKIERESLYKNTLLKPNFSENPDAAPAASEAVVPEAPASSPQP